MLVNVLVPLFNKIVRFIDLLFLPVVKHGFINHLYRVLEKGSGSHGGIEDANKGGRGVDAIRDPEPVFLCRLAPGGGVGQAQGKVEIRNPS